MRLRSNRRRTADDVAPTLDALARATAGGLSLGRALAELPDDPRKPFATALLQASRRQGPGRSLGDCLAAAHLEPSGTETRLALATLELLARVGGAVPAALDRAASAVRERRAAVAERQTQSAQARISALVLSALPVGFAVWGLQGDRRTATFLLHRPAGQLCLGVGLVLNGAGWLWMHRITGSDR